MSTLLRSGSGILAGLLLSACDPFLNRVAFHPDTSYTPEKETLPEGVQEIRLMTSDKIELTALYLPAPGARKILLFYHGNAGNIYHRIPALVALRQFGVNVLGVSYRGFGKSKGSPSERGLYLDGEAAFSYAHNTLGFTEEDIIVVGRSIGSTVATHIARNKPLAGLILITPLTNAQEMAKPSGLGMFSWLVKNRFDNLSRIRETPSPLLIIHGTNDRIVPFHMGVALFEQADTEKQFVKIENGGHNDLEQQFAAEYWSAIKTFITRLL